MLAFRQRRGIICSASSTAAARLRAGGAAAGAVSGAGGLLRPVEVRVELASAAKGQAMAIAKNTICLWYDKDAAAAAHFYAETFPDSAVGAVHHAPSDYPSGKAGDVLTVEFTVVGIACIGLNGGPAFKHNEAFSFQIATDDQQETDRYWNSIVGNDGQ